jgi:adenylate kinase
MESYDLDAVIHLELPDEEVRRRVLSRRLCPNCGMDYNLIADRPEQEGRCDICGHDLVTRADDTPEALEARLRDYHVKTRPVLELFRRKEVVHDVDSHLTVDEVQGAIRKTLDLPPYLPASRGR